MGIALEIVEVAKSALPADIESPRVEQINLKVGRLSGVVADYLNFCLEVAVKDTPLEGAVIHIDEIPVVARCRQCSHQWEADNLVSVCPACRSTDLEILSGRELNVVSLDIEEGEVSDESQH